jgi:hypothetical protein
VEDTSKHGIDLVPATGAPATGLLSAAERRLTRVEALTHVSSGFFAALGSAVVASIPRSTNHPMATSLA